MRSAPLFTKAYDLTQWLLQRTQTFPKSQRFVLARRIDDAALNLLECVALALAGIDREDNVDRADAALVRLRLHVRLASDLELLRANQRDHALRAADELGRMVGGWRKQL